MGGRNRKNKNAKGSKPDVEPKGGLELIVAKYGILNTVTGALIGAIGVSIAAYFGYLGIRLQTMAPIYAAQTSTANYLTGMPSLTPTESPVPLQTSTPSPVPTQSPVPLPTNPPTEASPPSTPGAALPPPIITMPTDGASVGHGNDVFGTLAQSALEPGIYLSVIVVAPSDGPPTYHVQVIPEIQANGTWRSSPVFVGTEGSADAGKTFQICAVLHDQPLHPGAIPSFPAGPKSCIEVVRG